MNLKYLLISGLCVLMSIPVLAQEPDMDTALSTLSKSLAKQIEQNGNKKVAVLDFTDLQGGSSELGRYIAEDLTVDLVMDKHSFAILDRANLKQILAEHKLTAEGLVNPANAKKLGQFAGVDALIIGNVIPMGSNVKLTVKIITTDTAEIIGAAQATFQSDSIVQKLLAKTVAKTNARQEPPKRDFDVAKATYTFGPLKISLSSFRVTRQGQIIAILSFDNTDTNNAIRVALDEDDIDNVKASLLDGQGDQYYAHRDVQGIAIRGRSGYWYSPTDTAEQIRQAKYERMSKEMVNATTIQPGSTIPATLDFTGTYGSNTQAGSAFRLQCEFTEALPGSYGHDTFRQETLLIPGIRPHAAQ